MVIDKAERVEREEFYSFCEVCGMSARYRVSGYCKDGFTCGMHLEQVRYRVQWGQFAYEATEAHWYTLWPHLV